MAASSKGQGATATAKGRDTIADRGRSAEGRGAGGRGTGGSDTGARTAEKRESMPLAGKQFSKVRGAKCDRRVVRTRKAIREAFKRLVRNTSYDKVTITAIAREADIDRKTFYLHYDSVDDVVDEIVCEEANRMVSLLRTESFSMGDGVDVADLFSRLSVVLVRNFVANGEVIEHVAPELMLKKVERYLTEAIVEDDALGLASAMGSYLRYCVSFFCAGLVAVYRDWLKRDSEIPLESLAAVTTTAILSGVEGLVRSGKALSPVSQKRALL